MGAKFLPPFYRFLAWNGSFWRAVALDLITRALIFVSYMHHEIHGGSAFVCSDVQNVDTTTQYWMFTTPNTTKYDHVVFDIAGTGEISLVLTEGADRTGTTALAMINRRRVGSPGAATATVHRDYSAGTTNGAVTLFRRRAGSTGLGAKASVAGGSRDDNEFILAANTKYVVAIETFADIYVSLAINWYEHTDKAA